jgi:hypothetical protein
MPVIATNNNNNPNDASYSMLFSPAASSLASTPGGGMMNAPANNDINNIANSNNNNNGGVELEINWDPTIVKNELIQASAILSHRGLKLAAKWAAEQVVGIPVGQPASLGIPEDDDDIETMELQQQQQQHRSPAVMMPTVLQEEYLNMTEQDWYAKSLLDLGEFLHAASVLSQDVGDLNDDDDIPTNKNTFSQNIHNDISQIGPPRQGLSSFGVYARAYSLYMAGERRKEEEYAALERYVVINCILVHSLVGFHFSSLSSSILIFIQRCTKTKIGP